MHDTLDPRLPTPSASAGLAEGFVLAGRYRIRAPVGRGGMGEVYDAEDLVLGRPVAVKLLRQPLSADPTTRDRFIREARAAASLSHPNIVAVHDAGIDGGLCFIVMELLVGEPLSDLIARVGRLDAERTAEIAEGVAEALAAAHDHGIVHRDIKPGNVMVTETGWVKVLDFGIARALAWTPLSDQQGVHGTAEYLSPEQARDGRVDGRSDLYSLGAVLFEMLAGTPPFTGDVPAVVARRQIDDPPPMWLLPEAVPAGLRDAVARCLQKDPNDRYPNARQLARELRRLRTDRRGMTAPISKVRTTDELEPPPPDVAERPRRRRGPMVGLAVVTVLVLTAAALAIPLLFQGKAPAAPKPRPQPLLAPSRLIASASCDGFLRSRVSLSWDSTITRRADGYAIYRGQSPDGPFRKIELLTRRDSTSFVDTGLGDATRYFYVVRTTSGSHLSAYSSPTSVRTPSFCLF